jgi:hypothetical protein
MTNRLRPFGGILLVVGVFYLGLAFVKYNSAAEQVARALGGGHPSLVFTTIYGLAQCIVGVLLLTSEPALFLRLTRNGLITFVVLAGVIPILCWLPWLIPGLKQKTAQS